MRRQEWGGGMGSVQDGVECKGAADSGIHSSAESTLQTQVDKFRPGLVHSNLIPP